MNDEEPRPGQPHTRERHRRGLFWVLALSFLSWVVIFALAVAFRWLMSGKFL